MTTITSLALATALILQTVCATIETSVASPSLSQGQTQAITTTATYCGDRKTKLIVTVTVTDAVGNTVILRNTTQNYNPGQSVTFNDSYTVAANAPLGTYRVIAIVFDSRASEIARSVVTFQVV